MSRLLESIRIQNNQAQNLSYHQTRINQSQKSNFQHFSKINLEETLSKKTPFLNPSLIYKCRILYGQNIEKIEFQPYTARPIASLKLVYDDSINYEYKWENRSNLQQLLQQKKDCTDILIIKKGLVTDSSYSNIVFFDGKKWWTPSTPLLAGTQRAKLLAEGCILERKIAVQQIQAYQSFQLINAMLPFHRNSQIPVSHIQ